MVEKSISTPCFKAYDFHGRVPDKHKHSSIGLLTSKQVHYGLADNILAQQSQVLQASWINRLDNEIDFLNGFESESALVKVPCLDREAPQGNLDMKADNASFLMDGEKSSIETDRSSVPMLH